MNIGQELRLALRLLAKERGFTILAALALGLGIGVSNTFFSLVNAAVLRGLPIDAPEQVMFLSLRDARNMARGLAYPAYDALRRETRTFASVGAYLTGPATLRDEGTSAERVLATSLSASGFRVLGVVPRLGREFRAEDDQPGAPIVVLLSERVWRARYGGRPSVLGESVTLNGEPATVVGVMPDSFRFPGNADVWRPLGADPGRAASSREPRLVSVFARLSRDASRAQAEAEFASFRAAWAKADPATYGPYRASIVPINQQFFGRVTDTVWLAFITAGVLVFLIACANVANLLLMRAAARGREVAIRMSLGATAARIVRQLLLESAVLAAIGGVAGLGLSLAGLRTLQALVPAEVARLFDFTLDARMVAAMVGASVASVFLFGLAPALHLARGSAVDVLKDDSQAGGTVTRRRWATAFLAAEFALTLVLLANVARDIWITRAARDAQFLIDPAPLLTMSVTLPNQPYDTVAARARFFDRLEEAVAALPSVSLVAVASALPGAGGPLQEVTIAGQPSSPSLVAASVPRAATLLIGERYFDAIGARLVSGRAFMPSDGMPGQDAAIVNQRFADLFLPAERPIGSLIRVAGPQASDAAKPWLRVVGVAPSVRQSAVDGIQPDPVVYLPARSAPSPTMSIIVRAQGDPAEAVSDPAALASPIRAAIRRLDPSLPVDRAMTMAEATRQMQWNGRISRVLLDGVAAISFLLALVGLYAVTTHSVRLRRKELGIRIALGASQRDVGTLVLRRVMFQLAIGLAIGLGATAAFDRLFTTTGMRLTDPPVLLASVLAILVVGTVACLWPAARAVRLNPAVALRDE
jgi:putative ABC transport system permease protein